MNRHGRPRTALGLSVRYPSEIQPWTTHSLLYTCPRPCAQCPCADHQTIAPRHVFLSPMPTNHGWGEGSMPSNTHPRDAKRWIPTMKAHSTHLTPQSQCAAGAGKPAQCAPLSPQVQRPSPALCARGWGWGGLMTECHTHTSRSPARPHTTGRGNRATP